MAAAGRGGKAGGGEGTLQPEEPFMGNFGAEEFPDLASASRAPSEAVATGELLAVGHVRVRTLVAPLSVAASRGWLRQSRTRQKQPAPSG